MVKRFLFVASVGLALFAPLGAVSTAHADTADNKFLAELKTEGITDHVSPSHAIEAGHMVCQKLSDGMTPNEVAIRHPQQQFHARLSLRLLRRRGHRRVLPAVQARANGPWRCLTARENRIGTVATLLRKRLRQLSRVRA